MILSHVYIFRLLIILCTCLHTPTAGFYSPSRPSPLLFPHWLELKTLLKSSFLFGPHSVSYCICLTPPLKYPWNSHTFLTTLHCLCYILCYRQSFTLITILVFLVSVFSMLSGKSPFQYKYDHIIHQVEIPHIYRIMSLAQTTKGSII